MSDQQPSESQPPTLTVQSEHSNDETVHSGVGSDSNDQSTPEFQEFRSKNVAASGSFELQRFGGVQVVLTAELGRIQVTIQELMGLSEGSILELNREISAPVELVAQGVPLGNGEVVVVDDRFAIRIKQIYQV